MLEHSRQQLLVGATLVFVTLVIGPVGYMFLEGWDFLDAMYMTIITITTTGFQEVHGLTAGGRIFTLVLIILGVGSIAYTSGRAVPVLFETQLFWRSRMSRKLRQLNEHFIVCGFGKMARYVCEEPTENSVPFVVVEMDPLKIEDLQRLNYLYVQGDATSDGILVEAGIERANGLVAVLDSDADNVFATLSAEALNPKTFVVARDKKVDLNIEEFLITDRSPLVHTALADSPIRKGLNIIVVTVNRSDGSFVYNPTSTTVLEAGDRVIALDEKANLKRLGQLCIGEQ